ncbi:hypothetical protein TEA_005310 [Camellia sinensis var. sinensis]|uniref:Pentatricopeptide repeat-containing protein-mitochondrial domain-containing protein n=1 Tax=Camellia sinensis var. sinensis TaxID=542762 RepID=A0A4S4EFZ0_CAMSN|nr:hypothetical protein TEA_005310 [Camellia sinensis var. sinensis]
MARPKPCHVHPSKPEVRIHISLSNLYRPNSATSDSELRLRPPPSSPASIPPPNRWMSATVRRVRNTLKVCFSSPFVPSPSNSHSSQTLISSTLTLTLPPKTLNSQLSQCCSTSSSSSVDRNFDFLQQFSPFPLRNSSNSSIIVINSNERRRIVVGLATMIKQQQGYLLKGFSRNFCPYFLVQIMKLFENRQIAFAFFKFSFGDDSKETLRSCCLAAHLLAAGGLRFFAQDLLSWVIARIGFCRSWEVVGFMWGEHHKYESDFSVLDSLMRAFLNAEMISRALEMVDRMREVGATPSLSAVTILFKLLLGIGDYGSVWKLFRDMVHKGPCPVNYTFNVIILGGQTSDGLALLHLMVGSGCNPSIVTFSTVINTMCKEGNVVEARKLFDGIQEIGVFPNTIMYNTLIDGYVKARDIGQANMLYEEMRNKGVAADVVTFNILVAGHYKYGREEDVDRLIRDLSMSGLLPDCSLSDISVAGLCWAGRLDEAMKILEDMLEKGIAISVLSFNSVIAAYSHAGLEDRAFETFKIMVKFGLSPSSSTCSSLLMALSKKGKLQEARKLMNVMIEKGYPVNIVAFTVILDGYFRTGGVQAAQSLWEEMQSRGMSPDAVAFSAMIDGLSKAGLVEEAYNVFLEMLGKGFVPNNYAYNSLIGGFCNCGRLSEALKLEKEMKQRGLLPDIFTINMIINGKCNIGSFGTLNTSSFMAFSVSIETWEEKDVYEMKKKDTLDCVSDTCPLHVGCMSVFNTLVSVIEQDGALWTNSSALMEEGLHKEQMVRVPDRGLVGNPFDGRVNTRVWWKEEREDPCVSRVQRSPFLKESKVTFYMDRMTCSSSFLVRRLVLSRPHSPPGTQS